MGSVQSSVSDPNLLAYIPEASLVKGNPKLAGRMGLFPETTIVRRFGALNSQNILRMQAELINMERDLRAFERDDYERHKREYSVDWAALSESATEADGNPRQLNLLNEIKVKLKEYSMYLTWIFICKN